MLENVRKRVLAFAFSMIYGYIYRCGTYSYGNIDRIGSYCVLVTVVHEQWIVRKSRSEVVRNYLYFLAQSQWTNHGCIALRFANLGAACDTEYSGVGLIWDGLWIYSMPMRRLLDAALSVSRFARRIVLSSLEVVAFLVIGSSRKRPQGNAAHSV